LSSNGTETYAKLRRSLLTTNRGELLDVLARFENTARLLAGFKGSRLERHFVSPRQMPGSRSCHWNWNLTCLTMRSKRYPQAIQSVHLHPQMAARCSFAISGPIRTSLSSTNSRKLSPYASSCGTGGIFIQVFAGTFKYHPSGSSRRASRPRPRYMMATLSCVCANKARPGGIDGGLVQVCQCVPS